MKESVPTFYSRHSLHVEIYDVQTQHGWPFPDDVDFYREIAEATGGPVLELGCGTGRVAIPLLSMGLEIHGLDASVAMLDQAKRKRDQLPEDTVKRLHLHAGDMSKFDLGQKFALIYIAFRSFQILVTPEAQRQCLICIRRHLAPGGKVVINLFDPRYDMILPGKQPITVGPRQFVHPISGNGILVETLERITDPVSQTFIETWRFTETDSSGTILRHEEEQLHLRWTFRYEMRHLVECCGFAVEAEYSDFRHSPPAYAKEQVWVLKAAS